MLNSKNLTKVESICDNESLTQTQQVFTLIPPKLQQIFTVKVWSTDLSKLDLANLSKTFGSRLIWFHADDRSNKEDVNNEPDFYPLFENCPKLRLLELNFRPRLFLSKNAPFKHLALQSLTLSISSFKVEDFEEIVQVAPNLSFIKLEYDSLHCNCDQNKSNSKLCRKCNESNAAKFFQMMSRFGNLKQLDMSSNTHIDSFAKVLAKLMADGKFDCLQCLSLQYSKSFSRLFHAFSSKAEINRKIFYQLHCYLFGDESKKKAIKKPFWQFDKPRNFAFDVM